MAFGIEIEIMILPDSTHKVVIFVLYNLILATE